MKALWAGGPSSVREVHERVSSEREWAYSTTKTIMDRMITKSFLTRGDFHGVFLYRPRITKPEGLARLVRNFAERVLEVDPAPVVALFARSEALTPAEMEELSRLLADEEVAP